VITVFAFGGFGAIDVYVPEVVRVFTFSSGAHKELGRPQA